MLMFINQLRVQPLISLVCACLVAWNLSKFQNTNSYFRFFLRLYGLANKIM